MSVWRKKNLGLMQFTIARKIVAPLFLIRRIPCSKR